jgi:hypothetical protein
MTHDANALPVELSTELLIRSVPFLSTVNRKAHILGPSQNFRGIMDHRIEILHESKALRHPLAIAADMFEAKDHVTMSSEVLCLRVMRIPITTRTV